ncbi:hypothetical protein Gotur_030400 [Gossypium turneri]
MEQGVDKHVDLQGSSAMRLGLELPQLNFFVENGAYVVIADILDEPGTLLTDSIGACYIHCDVAKESDVESAIQLAITWKGKLDILFSNAGIGGIASSITSLDMEQYKRFHHMYVEFHRYHWRVSVSPLLFVEIWYHQTNVNSGMQNFQGNETTPEQVKTLVGEEGILLRGKAATVEDVAKAAVFLASDDNGFITAHNLVIYGGYTSAISSEFHLQVVKN